MIRVERQRTIEGATPKEVFQVLSNPDGLTLLLPRLRKAELKDQGEDNAILTLCISIGNMFGTVCFRGKVSWVEPREVVFRIANPIPAEIRWNLTQTELGTDVLVVATLDLKPLLGPMINFIPMNIPTEMIGKELEHALKEIANRFKKSLPTQCVAVPIFA